MKGIHQLIAARLNLQEAHRAGHPQKPVGIRDFVIHLSCRDVEAGRWNIDRFSDLRSTLSD